MRLLRSILFGVVAASALAPAMASPASDAKQQARLDKAIAGRVAGKPVDCIQLSDIRSSEIIDRTAILYYSRNGRIYVNTPRAGQESLDNDDILVTKTWGSQLCRLDTVRLIDRGSRFETGFVGLGDFVPYERVAKN